MNQLKRRYSANAISSLRYRDRKTKTHFLIQTPQPHPSTATRPVEPVEPVHEATRGRRAGFAYLKATLAHPVCCTCQSFEIYASL